MEKGKIVQYRHHGVLVKVDSNLKGTHREYCLCFRGCHRFHPEDREKNCPIANLLFEVDRAFGIVTPVFECGLYSGGH